MATESLLSFVRSGSDLTSRIGGTPLVPVTGLSGIPAGVTVLGKAEWMNPGGSVKDRAAWGIVRDALDSERLLVGRRLLDATSGNTGIAYAWIGATMGFGVTLCLPANANAERRRLMAALGAELVLTDAMDGTDGAIREARRLAAEHPDRYAYVDQYAHPENWRAHYFGTAAEIWADTHGEITHLVAGIGTSGTLMGTTRRLRELNPSLTAIAVQPDSPLHALEGLKHLPSAIVPEIYDAAAHDQKVTASTEKAYATCAEVLRDHGLLVGHSAGAALWAAREVGRGLTSGVIVALLPDGGERYLGTKAGA